MERNTKEEAAYQMKYATTPDPENPTESEQIQEASYFEDMSVEHEIGESPTKDKDGDTAPNAELVSK